MARKKKYQFLVTLYLQELSWVPFVNGLLYAKVRLLDGRKFTNRTTSCIHQSPSTEVKDHSVVWESKFQFTCKMSANTSSGVLNSCKLRISVRKEVKGGLSSLKLGFVDLDLAEYAGAGLTPTQRFLLEPYPNTHRRSDNSTLKLKLEMSLLNGDPLFKRPSHASCTLSQFDNDNGSTAVHTPQGSNDAEDEKDQQIAPARPPSVGAELQTLVNSNDDKSCEDAKEEDVGLQLLVGKDGTATLGSRSGTNERKKKQHLNQQPKPHKEHISMHQSE